MITQTLPAGLDEVDVIIVGGGTAASVIAARLSDADPQLTVLVIERGRDNYNVPNIVHPALFRANFDPAEDTMLYYVSQQEEQVANRNIIIGTGGVLGGGSSINAYIYARAQAVDFDDWATEGWSSKDLVPLLKKMETYYPAEGAETHGTNGPAAVSGGTYQSVTFRDDFFSAANKIGYPTVEDVQDLRSGNAVSPSYRFVSPTTGRRQDAAHVYLHPRVQDGAQTKKSGNLHILVESQVSRVLFDDDKRASGVEYRNHDGLQTVKARKLVVLSAGALGNPQILERSGVGKPEILQKAGVPLVEAVEGVGHQYQDHEMVVVVYDSTLDTTIDTVVNGGMDVNALIKSDSNILSWNGVDAYGKLRPTESEVQGFEPGLRAAWDRDFANSPEKPLAIFLPMSGTLGPDASLYPTSSRYISLACYNAYPYSRGSVHISGPGLEDPLDFKSGYLSDPEGADLQILVWAYKKQRELARRMSTALLVGEKAADIFINELGLSRQ